jgi:hypothetical protein
MAPDLAAVSRLPRRVSLRLVCVWLAGSVNVIGFEPSYNSGRSFLNNYFGGDAPQQPNMVYTMSVWAKTTCTLPGGVQVTAYQSDSARGGSDGASRLLLSSWNPHHVYAGHVGAEQRITPADGWKRLVWKYTSANAPMDCMSFLITSFPAGNVHVVFGFSQKQLLQRARPTC